MKYLFLFFIFSCLFAQESTSMTEKGYEYYYKGDYSKAIKILKKAIEENPRDDITYSYLGLIYDEMEKIETAEKYYKIAIRINKKSSSALYNMGLIEFNRANYKKAIKFFKRVIKIFPNEDDDSFHNIGLAYLAIKDTKKAKINFEKALEINQFNGEALFSYGKLLYNSGEKEKGIKQIRQAVSLNNPDAFDWFVEENIPLN